MKFTISGDFSVIIPTYQRRERVRLAVTSVLAGNSSPREIIVVDDGSTDGTAESLEGIDERVSVVRHAENRGVSAARNTGIGRATGRWLALLDSDDRWLPDHLERLARYLEANRECRIAQTLERWYRDGRRVNQRQVHRPGSGDIFEPSLHRCLVSSSAVVLDRELFEASGGYDERLPACEDYDLWLRLATGQSYGLVEVETVVKDGGRADQLSRRIWGLDRFRVFALAKLLLAGLEPARERQVKDVCQKKLSVLEAGAAKRGKRDAVAAYRRWQRAVSGDESLLSLIERADVASPGQQADPILDALRPRASLSSPILCEQGRSA